MVSKIQVFELGDGGTVAVEVEVLPGEEERISNAEKRVVENTGERFETALEGVEKAAAVVLDGFVETLKPDELELTFGIKFGLGAGVVLASVDAESTMSVTAKWKNKKSV